MKLTALLAALAFTSLAAGAAPPALPIDQALKLAQDYLTERGLADAHYIGSLSLESVTLTGGETFWLAKWVPSIVADGKKESALRINMDGSLVRLTSGGTSGAAARSDAPGVRRVGARNIR